MKKLWASLLAALLIVPMLYQPQASAATPISVYIDGNRLATDQAPVIVNGRVMLPMRAIFEALDATVNYNQTLKTVTAYKTGTTVVLKLNSRSATINNEAVLLDVPAQSIKGRTLVPVRFVSEALGQQVDWNSQSKRVTINTGSGGGGGGDTLDPNPVAYVYGRDVANHGDGRDLEVSFSKSSNESRVDHYRIMIVKAANASGFNLAAAQKVASGNYTSLAPSGSDPALVLSSNAKDVDGSAIRENQAYVAFVLAVGKGNSGRTLSTPSPSVTLQNSSAVAAASNVRVTDVSDFGDGRDLSVSFTRASSESSIANYRVFVVKTKDASNFNLTAANKVPTSYSTVVYKSGSSTTLTGQLTSSSRDTSGELIKSGVSYTVFVLSVSNAGTASSKLSTGSSAITLSTGSMISPVITQVEDWNDYGDGRDLRISFNRISDESRISSYRIFVVKSSDYASFSLAKANTVSSRNYIQVNKTGYNISQYALPSGARDVDGTAIRNGVGYRVFVMAVGTGSYEGSNTLSSASSAITLTNGNSVSTVSNLNVSDVSDLNDGRDLRVSFNPAADEYNISSYRILVVKASDAGNFTLSRANNVSRSNYTEVSKTGYTQSLVLGSGARDVDGSAIRNGVSYRVFVLSVANNNYNLNNALSSYSSAITLSGNTITPASNVTATDIGNQGDGRDLRVSFTRSGDESKLSHYRILVVKANNAGSFDLSRANNVGNANYTYVGKGGSGSTLTVDLAAGARDVDGATIRNGVSYRVYVLSVAATGQGSNALSWYSQEITLSDSGQAQAVSGLYAQLEGNSGTYRDIIVSFNKLANESNVAEYRILAVPQASVGSFRLADANDVRSADRYTSVTPFGSNVRIPLQTSKDVWGNELTTDTTYQFFVLTVAQSGGTNALSQASNGIKLVVNSNNVAVAPVTQVSPTAEADRISVAFNPPTDNRYINSYVVFAAPDGQSLNLDAAIQLASRGASVSASNQGPITAIVTQDVNGNALNPTNAYNIYVLSVPDMVNAKLYALSSGTRSNVFVPAQGAGELTQPSDITEPANS